MTDPTHTPRGNRPRARCTARRRNGEQCGNWAMTGQKVCRMHGGSAPQAREAAKRRIVEQELRRELSKVIEPKVVDPAPALLDLIHWTAGEVAFWRERLAVLQEQDPDALSGESLDEDATKVAGRVHRLLNQAMDRLAGFAALALRAGVEERRVRLAEQQGAVVAQVIRAILDDLHLSAEQAARVGTVVPRHLRLLAGGRSA